MENSRLELLKKFYEDEPGDPFNAYALALEVSKSDQSQAFEILRKLMHDHPDYAPSYYQAAQFAMVLALYEEAKKIIAAGLKIVKDRDQKAFKELNLLRDSLNDCV